MFKIEFETSNAAFVDNYRGEIIRILKEIAEDIAHDGEVGPIHDANGNTVGWYNLNEED